MNQPNYPQQSPAAPGAGKAKPPQQGGAKLVIVALLLALVSVVLTNVYISLVKRQMAEQTFDVFTLTRSVRTDDQLRDRDIQAVAVPQRFKQQFEKLGVMSKVDLDARRGQMVQRSMPQGALVTYDLFLAPEGAADVNKIPPGMRQFSLPLDPNQQPGSLRPEMKVDITAPFNLGGEVPVVMTVMEDVRVAAVGRFTATEDNDSGRSRRISGYRNFTIVVKPEVAKRLAMIKNLAVGGFQLLIRNPGDNSVPRIPNGEINPQLEELLKQKVPNLRQDTGPQF